VVTVPLPEHPVPRQENVAPDATVNVPPLGTVAPPVNVARPVTPRVLEIVAVPVTDSVAAHVVIPMQMCCPSSIRIASVNAPAELGNVENAIKLGV
jgi:hypothetical protein